MTRATIYYIFSLYHPDDPLFKSLWKPDIDLLLNWQYFPWLGTKMWNFIYFVFKNIILDDSDKCIWMDLRICYVLQISCFNWYFQDDKFWFAWQKRPSHKKISPQTSIGNLESQGRYPFFFFFFF